MSELFETTKRWDAIAASVPAIVDRLQTLKVLHEQGAEFGKTLAHLETVQSQIKDQLSAQTSSLTSVNEPAVSTMLTMVSQVEKSFQDNMAVIQNNFQSLDRRIADISGKLEQLH